MIKIKSMHYYLVFTENYKQQKCLQLEELGIRDTKGQTRGCVH